MKIPRKVPKQRTGPYWGFRKALEGEDQEFDYAIEEMIEVLEESLQHLENGDSLRKQVTFIEGKGFNTSVSGLRKLWHRFCPDSPKIKEYSEKVASNRKERDKTKPKVLTKEERRLLKQKRKIANERLRITAAKKRIEKLANSGREVEGKIEEIKEVLSAPVVVTELLKGDEIEEKLNRQVAFEPNPGPQTEFLAASEQEVLYGGAAGGGKSYALITDPMRYFDNPNFNGLLLRRTNDELRELVWNTKKLYPSVFPKANFGEKSSEWRLPKGGRLWMSYLDRDDDVLRYQGQAFSWIGVDELTQYPTAFAWNYLRSRLRATDLDLKPYLSMRATTNPGGPGHGWVKKMFVDPAPPNKAFWATNIDTGETLIDPDTGLPLFKRRFIPARLVDNPYLAEDGVYRRNLLSMDDRRRDQLLEGDWTVADGAAFPEFRLSKHVVDPFDIPKDWSRFRACDYGYSSYSCVLWFAIDPMDDQLVCYRELYVSKYTGEQLADTVLHLERDERVRYGVLDSSVWHKRGEGPSIAEVMIQKGCRWRPSDRSPGSRVAGKNRLHELLKVNESTNRPGIVFFNTCRNVISTLQVIPTDPHGNDDIDDRFKDDHSYDATRYAVMSRPKSTPWWMEQQDSSNGRQVPLDRVFGY